MAGMPPGFAALLRRKYELMQQDADTRQFNADTSRVGTNAAANLDAIRAGLLPAESKANIGLTGAQAQLARSNAANVDETTKFVGPLARSAIDNNAAQAFNYRSAGGLNNAETEGKSQLNRFLNYGMFKLSGN